ncbi:hypothetical protein [Pseudomonas aeruginosa]|uniref:hypothetical protein n=1 Tax=Pseudomonas aeruginosa TaxID=287 RepID=UPI0012988057|nr:hypothetical protein [Pseudomonas aeruginosa]
MNDKIGNCTLKKATERNLLILLENVFEPLFERSEFLKILEDASIATSDPTLQAALEQQWESEANEHEEEIRVLLKNARYACLYIKLANTAEEKKEYDRAWAFTNHASLITGETLERSRIFLNQIGAEARSKQNIKNALGRNKAAQLAREEAARLLTELKPDGGWPSKNNAAAKLAGPLSDFIKEKKVSGLSWSNTESRIKIWMNEVGVVRDAWDQNRKQ